MSAMVCVCVYACDGGCTCVYACYGVCVYSWYGGCVHVYACDGGYACVFACYGGFALCMHAMVCLCVYVCMHTCILLLPSAFPFYSVGRCCRPLTTAGSANALTLKSCWNPSHLVRATASKCRSSHIVSSPNTVLSIPHLHELLFNDLKEKPPWEYRWTVKWN